MGGEFRIFADNSAITPTTISIKPQGYSGVADVQPALTSNSILYVQGQGARVRELSYDWRSKPSALSTRASWCRTCSTATRSPTWPSLVHRCRASGAMRSDGALLA